MHLQDLQLADTRIIKGGQQNDDVPSGSDYYFNVASGDVICGEDGPVVMRSMLEWMFSAGHMCVEESTHKFTKYKSRQRETKLHVCEPI